MKKFYPLRLRPWAEFGDEVQRKGFARIYAALQNENRNGLPSRVWVQQDEETLLGQLPLQALNQEGGLNAARTNDFLNVVLLIPTSRVLNQYLNQGIGSNTKIFLDTAVQSVVGVLRSVSTTPSQSSVENAENAGSAQSPSSNLAPRKVLPDCAVLCIDSNDTLTTATAPARLITVGEHKPCHAIRAAAVAQMIPLPEDIMIRLARQVLARRKSKLEKLAAATRASGSEFEQEPESEPGSRPAPAATAASKTKKIDKQTYFVYALTQAYHYMLVSGVEYGYLSTGEVIVFLRILEDDATTLYYHVSIFPIPGPKADDCGSIQVPQAVTKAPFPAPGDPVGETALGELPIAQMASFCELARHAARRPASWVIQQTASLARFPDLPPSVAARYGRRPSSRLGRRRRDDDNDNNDDNDDADDHGRVDSSRRQLHVPSHRGGHVRSASPLQQQMTAGQSSGPDDAVNVDISTSFLSTYCDLWTRPRPSRKVAPSILPYCTQACLLGLVQNGPLDQRCPNYALHQAAATTRKEDMGDSRHPLTSLELAQRIRDQLFDTPEADCECFMSLRGAVGYPFKLTLTGFGYTLIGKAVEDFYSRRLVHESKIYRALLSLQGSVIPVHLGLIQLHVGYPVLSQFLQLPYMMLLSYAGESMAGSLLVDEEEEEEEITAEKAHHRAEAARTQQALENWGLVDEDDNVTNLRWCSEVGRAMRIDFDRAHLVHSLCHQHHPPQMSQMKGTSQTSQTVSSHGTPTTPMREDDSLDLTEQMRVEPAIKRRKLDDDDDNKLASINVAVCP